MKKRLVVLMMVMFLLFSAYLSLCEEKRIYNDGVIDYVPLTASFVLEGWDSESSLQKIQYSIDGAPLDEYTEPLSMSTEGRHIIVYRAVDTTGNISNERVYSVVVDGTPPEGLVSADGPVYRREGDFFLTTETAVVIWAEDTLSGVDTIWVGLDDGEYMAYTGPVVIGKEGYHTARTFAVDNVGNRSKTYKVSGYVDSTPPEVEIVRKVPFVDVNDENYTNRSNEYSVIATDEISGVREIWISLDNSKWVRYTGPFTVQIPGMHSLRARASDNLGNVSEPAEVTFYVDIVPPETTLGTSLEE
jgi:hypothetical protein